MLKLEKKSQYLNSIFQLNYTKQEKTLWYKIFYHIKICKFESQHFFIRCIFFFLISKNTVENRKFKFLTIIHYRSKLWDHLFFDDCLNYLDFNSVSDKICSLNELDAIKILYKMSSEWNRFVKFWRRYCKKSQNFNISLNFK